MIGAWRIGTTLLLLGAGALAKDDLTPTNLAKAIRFEPRGAAAEAAAEMLARGGAKGWDQLASLVLHFAPSDPEVARRLIRQLADGAAPVRADRLARLYKRVKSPEIRGEIAVGLASFYPARATLVQEHLKKGGARGAAVVFALDAAGAPTSVLVECLGYPDVALVALGRIRQREDAPDVRTPSAAGREAALLGLDAAACARFLRSAPDFDLLAAAAALLKNEDRSVRVGAHALLMAASGKRLAADPLIWKSWVAAKRNSFEPPAEPSEGAVAAAILRGREFLRTRLLRNGYCADNWDSDRSKMGATALALLALRKSGMKRNDPVIESTLEKTLLLFDKAKRPALRKLPSATETYTAALLAMLLAELDRERFKLVLDTLGSRLARGQMRNGGWTYLAGYGTGKSWLTGDASNTQYAVLGLRALRRAGVTVQDELWEKAAAYWRDRINEHQGWPYSPGVAWDPMRRISMTAAGVASLAICLEALEPGKAREKIDSDETIQAGLHGLGRLLFLDEYARESLYALYSVERAGVLANVRDFLAGKRRIDWYRQGAIRLLSAQAPDGSWGTRQATWLLDRTGWGPDIDTAYAILFLARATVSIGKGKLRTIDVELKPLEQTRVTAPLRPEKREQSPAAARTEDLLRLEGSRPRILEGKAQIVGRIVAGARIDVGGNPVEPDADGWFRIEVDAAPARTLRIVATLGKRTETATVEIEPDTVPPTVTMETNPHLGPGRKRVLLKVSDDTSHLLVGRRLFVVRGRSVVIPVELKEGQKEISLDAFDYAGNKSRVRLPVIVKNRVLRLDGKSAVSAAIPPLPQAITVECWARPASISRKETVYGRTLVANAMRMYFKPSETQDADVENSGFGLYWRRWPDATQLPCGVTFRVGKKPATAAPHKSPRARAWVHLALTVDKKRMRLYVNGKLAGEETVSERWIANRPLLIGAEYGNRNGKLYIPFKGEIDGVRVSRGVRYQENKFKPAAHPEQDDITLLLLNFDGPDPMTDTSPFERAVTPIGAAKAIPMRR